MPTIKVESVNVHRIFDEVFTALTQKISSIELTKEEEVNFSEKTHLFIIKTKGSFQGKIYAEIEEGLMEQIVSKINKGRKMQDAEKILFTMEYLNIVCGRALSEINNQTGNRSRLTVPHYVTDKTSEEITDGESEMLFYQSTHGCLKVTVVYKIE